MAAWWLIRNKDMDPLDDRYRNSSLRNERLDILKTDKEPDEALLEALRDSLLKDKANVRENSFKTLKPDRKRWKGRKRPLLPVIAVVSITIRQISSRYIWYTLHGISYVRCQLLLS